MRARDGARSDADFRASDFGGEDPFQLFALQKDRYSLASCIYLLLAADPYGLNEDEEGSEERRAELGTS